ncbi:MAG TPA: tol-pal system protein YbgF, partial [Gammaproteobacteria bacterium]|nr:tol-pal system protein YbgF [Gammaproteobacteria bacterium]
MQINRVLLVTLLAVGVSACAQPQQIELLEREQRRIRSDHAGIHNEVESMRSSLADTRANMQQLQREFSALKERIEETRYQVGRQIGQSNRDGDQRVKDLEARVAKLIESFKLQEGQLKAREEELRELQKHIRQPQTMAGGASAGPTEVSAAETEAVRSDYEIAWRALEKKDYRLAISRFKEFLQKHPRSKLANNAQYWIGESHYALREFDQAILEFDAVRSRYPQADKVPAALLKQGFAFAELGEKVNARLILQEVVEKYAQSPEAAQAKQKIKSLES